MINDLFIRGYGLCGSIFEPLTFVPFVEPRSIIFQPAFVSYSNLQCCLDTFVYDESRSAKRPVVLPIISPGCIIRSSLRVKLTRCNSGIGVDVDRGTGCCSCMIGFDVLVEVAPNKSDAFNNSLPS